MAKKPTARFPLTPETVAAAKKQLEPVIREQERARSAAAYRPERQGADYQIQATRPTAEAPPEGGNHSSGRTVHSRVGEYGEFHQTNVYDDANRSGVDDVKRDAPSRFEDAMDRGYDPHERY